ncbi:hypothetical protein [Paenibacillus sedimenti]|uniref:Uncharacterized protein n=1 Tax=Paenibacillus sedimenti TaxID=2770274 RepID=A0A926QKA1_9BACL|nr:hypothetical protein [Paenibacillus sedimenti]MBD0381264.1 hypothetical protein [Paenibacillus sedimenti]
MSFDWNKKRFMGEEPIRRRRTWRDLLHEHPKETVGLFLLAVALLVWWGVV